MESDIAVIQIWCTSVDDHDGFGRLHNDGYCLGGYVLAQGGVTRVVGSSGSEQVSLSQEGEVPYEECDTEDSCEGACILEVLNGTV